MTDPVREAFEMEFGKQPDEDDKPMYEEAWTAWQAAWQQSRREALMEAALICDREGSFLASGLASVAAETARNCATLIRAAAEEEGK